MKKQHFIWILASLLAFAGCDEDKSPYAPTGGEALRIDASVEEIVLDPANNAQTAVTFTWNRVYTYGSAVSVEYCFKMDIADNNFATATDLEVLGPDVFERSFTVEELNDLCLERWGITPGESARLEGKVIARLTADKFLMPGVATTAFDVQTYELPSAPLYLLGDAVEVDGAALGWEPSKAVAMTEEVLSRQYSYKGRFRTGEYILPRQRTSLLPAFFRGADASSMELCTDAEGTRLRIDRSATYRLVVNTKRLTHTLVYYPEYEFVYMVGGATPGNWAIEKATPLTWVEGTAQFVYEGPLVVGELKFPAGKTSWDAPFFMPVVEDCTDLTMTGVQLVQPGGVDYKWRVTEAGNYRITLDIDALTISFEKR